MLCVTRGGEGCDGPSERPAVLYTALLHGREPVSLSCLLHFLRTVLRQAEAGEPGAAALLSRRKLLFLPTATPPLHHPAPPLHHPSTAPSTALHRPGSHLRHRHQPRPPPPPLHPQVNPDGWAWNEEVRPRGGGMKRKNGLRSCGRGVRPGPSDGVDLNRNFGFKWGYTKQQGSSAQGCAEEYRGAAPFSEPETRAVRDVIARHSVAAVLHWHG
jgi:hypothetical protein